MVHDVAVMGRPSDLADARAAVVEVTGNSLHLSGKVAVWGRRPWRLLRALRAITPP
ncbi:MAG: hypothetical protein ACLGIB_12600 [Actinomycetota bacterium]